MTAAADPRAPDLGLWIDGQQRPSAAGARIPIRNPATGEVLAHVARAGPEDVEAAVAAARRAWERGDWRRATSAERARVLLRLAERIRAEAERKPISIDALAAILD